MLDTTTINYTLDKLTNGIQQILPHAQNITADYVQYVVTREVIGFIISILLFIMSLVYIWVSYKYNENSETSCELDSFMEFSKIASIILCVACVIGVLCWLSSATLAVINPEMFVVHQLIK